MNKKKYFAIIAFLVFVINSVLYLTGLGEYIFVVEIASILLLLIVLFLLSKAFRGEKKEYIWQYIFLGYYVFALTAFLFFFPNLGAPARLSHILISSVWMYFVLLAMNVFVVSERRINEPIPLIQPAKVVIFITLLVTVFFGATEIYKFELAILPMWGNFLFKFIWFFPYYYFLAKSLKWFFTSYRVGEINENTPIIIKKYQTLFYVTLYQFSILLMFFPMETFARSMVLGSIAYVTVNYIINTLSHKINNSFYIESVLLLGFVSILALLI